MGRRRDHAVVVAPSAQRWVIGGGGRAHRISRPGFTLRVLPGVPPGVAVAEGVFWLAHIPGARNVNALTSQRLTDRAGGSTFYDNWIDVRAAP